MENEKVLFVGGRTVLFVDDEEKILSSIKRVFRDEPYNILFANSAKEALEILNLQDVHVLVTDIRMPAMSGFELIKIVKEQRPHIVRMVMSGFTETDILLEAINQGEIFRFIPKPWKSNEALISIIQQALENYELHGEHEILMQFFEQCTKGEKPELEDVKFLQDLAALRNNHFKWRKNTVQQH
jgi:DNA-binding NtrC family response regulator